MALIMSYNIYQTTYDYSFCKEPYAISVCRIEPENNMHFILEAFSRQIILPMVAVGNWKNSGYGLALIEKYKVFNHIHLLDPIYDAEQINFLRSSAFLYVHGHSAGGTNPSLVEAMFLGLPVFAFDCVYNRYTTENQCVYWSNTDELYCNITHYEISKLDDIGKNLKAIADKRYCWDSIVSKYEALFMA
jgi:glycosyltransferase involved in cell wall biosynthesis